MIKLCAFDLDGTLLDTLSTLAYYGNYALRAHGIKELPEEEYKYHAGCGMKNLIKNMLVSAGCYNEENYNKVLETYDNAYNADSAYKTKVFDGLKEVLDTFKKKGIKHLVYTNKPQFAAEQVLEHFFGKDYFLEIAGQRDGYPLKPDPYCLNTILEREGIKKDEVLYFGDTSVDMKTGKNAGVFTVGVLWGFRDEKELVENGADVIIKTPDEIYKIEASRNGE